MGSRSRRTEVKPPEFQPVFMNQQGQFFKTNPEYTKNLQKMSQHPMGAIGMAMSGRGQIQLDGRGRYNPSPMRPRAGGKTGIAPQPDQFIPISSPFGGMEGSMHSRQGYGKAKRYNPKRGSDDGMVYLDANNVEKNSRRPAIIGQNISPDGSSLMDYSKTQKFNNISGRLF